VIQSDRNILSDGLEFKHPSNQQPSLIGFMQWDGYYISKFHTITASLQPLNPMGALSYTAEVNVGNHYSITILVSQSSTV